MNQISKKNVSNQSQKKPSSTSKGIKRSKSTEYLVPKKSHKKREL